MRHQSLDVDQIYRFARRAHSVWQLTRRPPATRPQVVTVEPNAESLASGFTNRAGESRLMKIAIRRVHVLSALKFGLIFSPIMYTITRFATSGGGFGVGIGDYLGGLLASVLLGAILSAAGAFVYNLVAARFGPLKLELTIEES
jgi:hypothetical protein